MALNLRQLISISAQLSFEACQVIHQTVTQQSFKIIMKGEDNPVTDVPSSPYRQTIKFNHYSSGVSTSTSPPSG